MAAMRVRFDGKNIETPPGLRGAAPGDERRFCAYILAKKIMLAANFKREAEFIDESAND